MYDPNAPGPPPRRGRPAWIWVTLGAVIASVVLVVVVSLLLESGTIGNVGGSHAPFLFWGGFLFVFLLVWIAFFAIRMALWSGRRGAGYGGAGGPRGPHRDPAVMAARQRYARGEISREQFEQIMTDLGRRGRGPGGPLSGA